MKSRVISVTPGLLASGMILFFIVYCTGCGASPSASPQEEIGKGNTELTMESAGINPDAVITRTYTWEYDDKTWAWELQIPEGLYHYYREMPRSVSNNYSVYVTHHLDDEYIGRLAATIKEAADRNRYNMYKTICLASSFVQNLPYNPDSETTPYDEYARYPIETLVDDGGDCEDTSVLLAALLDSMGYGVVLVNPPDHLAVGILRADFVPGRYYQYEGGHYFYLETTKPGWAIGELPQTYRFSPAYVYGIEPIAVLTHSWTSETQDGSIMLDVTVENSGAIAADDVSVWAGFEILEGQWLNAETSLYFALPPDCSETVRLTLKIPPNKYTRLLIQVVDDGCAVDSSRSYWFDS